MLGRDGTASTLARFSGRLHDATLTRPANSAYDINDPTAAPTGIGSSYDCQGCAFTYTQRDIDGTRILEGDYRVTILRGSLDVIPRTGDRISIPPPGESSAIAGRVIRVESVTEAAVTCQCRGAPALAPDDDPSNGEATNMIVIDYTATGSEGTSFMVPIGATLANYRVVWSPQGVENLPLLDLPQGPGDRTSTEFRVVTSVQLAEGERLTFFVAEVP